VTANTTFKDGGTETGSSFNLGSVEISTPFQMLNYSFQGRPTQWNFRRQGAVAADPRFQDGGRKTGSSINRGLSCDIGIVSMQEYALKRLTDAVDGRSLYRPTLKIALSNYNVVDLSTGT
jgi:hypothetical protein